jgi:hypothetical protein
MGEIAQDLSFQHLFVAYIALSLRILQEQRDL